MSERGERVLWAVVWCVIVAAAWLWVASLV